ncbi:MAG TPA: hypothetical protein DEH78_32295, partial [Solibacterales bacterium]|nr:hypothetical protein [Bryobacterales bacterium]
MRHAALLLAGFALAAPAFAIDTAAARRYTTERRWVRQIDAAPSAALRAELEAHIVQWLDLAAASGTPKPLFLQIGITGGWIVFGNPGETASALAEALPHLTPGTQDRVKTFLRSFVRANDPTAMAFDHCAWGWGACELTGVRREYYTLPTSPLPDPLNANVYPPPAVPAEALYMLWRYADRTGDWDFISTSTPPSGERWNRIRTLFQSIPATPTRYGEVSGAIGYARMLERFNLSADASYNGAIAKVQAGLTAGTSFGAFLDASYARFLIGTHDWAFTPFHYLRQPNAVGAHLAPEIGRFLRENALDAVRARVTANPNEGQPGQKYSIEAHWPEWYLYRGAYPPIELWTGHYGENHMVAPDTPWALFLIHAFVYEEPGATLARYVDVPYGAADLFHIQRLAAAIEGYGTVAWSATDPGGTPPTNRPPSVVLTAPANGATFTAPATVTLTAAASDTDGTIERVEFLSGSTVLFTDNLAPYTFTWSGVGAGGYTLTARAVDDQGAMAMSAAAAITVTSPADTTPPTVPGSLTATAQSSSAITLAWTASTDNGAIAGYEIERNGALLGNLAAAPPFTDSGLQPSTAYSYRVRAVDGAGNRSGFSSA